jgi:general secretion pathway protein L
MRVDLLLQRWIDILAALVTGLLETWRARRAFIVVREKDGFVVRHGGAADGAVAATLTVGSPAPAEFIRAARQRFVTFELPADEIAVQRISVPARAREFLAGIVRNQIERISPWQGDQVAYGFVAENSRDDANSLDVRVLMASRTAVDSVRDELALSGVAVDQIVVREEKSGPQPPTVIWSRMDSASQAGLGRLRRAVALSLIAVAGLTAGLALWAQLSAASIRSDGDEVAARSAVLLRQLQAGRGGAAGALRDPAERAWNLKETSPSAVMILEALSQALPDAAFVTELSLQNATVRIVGLANDAPSLIALLEKSDQFADVHFFAPTTRSPDGASFIFHIEGHVTPKPSLAEN